MKSIIRMRRKEILSQDYIVSLQLASRQRSTMLPSGDSPAPLSSFVLSVKGRAAQSAGLNFKIC